MNKCCDNTISECKFRLITNVWLSCMYKVIVYLFNKGCSVCSKNVLCVQKMFFSRLTAHFYYYFRITNYKNDSNSLRQHTSMKALASFWAFFLLFAGHGQICYPTENLTQENNRDNPLIATGLSNQQVNAFAEDGQGHVWIGTFRGLNKFNVYEFHQYFCTDDSTSLPDNQVKDMLRDSKGRLWISTVNGVCLYTDRDNFRHIPTDRSNRNGVQLLESHDGRIFLNYVTHLAVYNPETDRMECVLPQLAERGQMNVKCFIGSDNDLWVVSPTELSCYDLTTFQLKDSVPLEHYPWYYHLHKDGMLWITGARTLMLYDTGTHRFAEVPQALKRHPILSQSEITLIHPYGDNCLLLNTSGHGIFCYNYEEGKVIHQSEEEFPFEAPGFRISRMFTDSRQNLWIGSADQGFSVCYHYKERFNNDNYLRTFFHNKSVMSLAPGANGILWITTLNDGVFRYDLAEREIVKIDMERLFPDSRQTAVQVNQLLVDAEDNLWMTASNNKVLKCRWENGRLQVKARYDVYLPMSIAADSIGGIWIGTATTYIYHLRPGDPDFRRIEAFEPAFTFIPGLLPLKNGEMLAAAFYQPLRLIDTRTEELRTLEVTESDLKASIKRSVLIPTVLYEDSEGEVWIGTVTNGLLRYSPSTGRLQPVPGVACTDISSIEEDAQGNLWVSTLYGLSKYDRATERFTNYYDTDGIGGNQFSDRASCHLADGTLVFGGTHGLTFFQPVNVQAKRDIPVLFENLKVHNQLVHPGDGQCIDRHLSYNPDIHLQHDQNGFSISFAALDYSEHERVHYFYKLEGFDRYWIDAHNNREAYYANLPAGKYNFKVRIMDNDRRVVEAENSIRLFIAPAPWATWWAYLIYILTGATVAALFVRAWMRIRAEKAAALQAEREKQQEQRVNKMNMSFFANVSHEFRTPLTMISGPVAQLCNSPHIGGEDKNLLCIVQRSVNRMLQLVNQMLDFNKLENDTLKLQVKHSDLIVLLRRQTDIFRVNAQNKQITLTTYGLEDAFTMWLDEDKIDKIFANLMSNAMKYTPAGGKIKVSFDVLTRDEAARQFRLRDGDTGTQYAQVSVANTGEPIPADQLEKIFERYYQVDNDAKGIYNWGTGIGLYYARSLAVLHHGYLKAEQLTEEKGSVFTFILPTDDRLYTAEERAAESNQQPEVFPLPEQPQSGTRTPGEEAEDTDKPYTLMVVDDDVEVANYLRALLSADYRVTCHFSAESALKAMSEEAPDLVISDVVMPGKDGYWLCRSIKDDLQLCHIPVLLVTAKNAINDQVEGLNTGADAYVTKPFDPAYLQALIKSQLKNREKVRSLLAKATQTDNIGKDMLAPQDKIFMTELYQLMEKELSNPELDIVHMTEILHISRTKFYYKVKGLTGENPSSFFKTYKLNRAAELIASGKYNVSEIADLTGFSTHSYFSKAFKKQFGIAPSEYAAKHNPGKRGDTPAKDEKPETDTPAVREEDK